MEVSVYTSDVPCIKIYGRNMELLRTVIENVLKEFYSGELPERYYDEEDGWDD